MSIDAARTVKHNLLILRAYFGVGRVEFTFNHQTWSCSMSIDRVVMAFAGTVVLLTLVLSQVHSVYWLWFTAFVGANLLQAAFTGFCPLAMILKALGVRPGTAFD
jgi:hypothetical protein